MKLPTNTTSKAASRGFTLIEIMVVVVILGILATMVVPKIMSRPDDARRIRAQQDIRAVKAALELYRLDNFDYPPSDQGLQALVTPPQGSTNPDGSYLPKVPEDPWGRPYQYLNPGVKSEIDVFSYGADGAPGGEGRNTDIGSWDLN